jgi:hypothetical protein
LVSTTKQTQIKQFRKYLQQQQSEMKVSLLRPFEYLLVQLQGEFLQISLPIGKIRTLTFDNTHISKIKYIT